MPYIPKEDRLQAAGTPETKGELNFAFTSLIDHYVCCQGLCYATCNDILGALEGAKLEFYRRVVAPYEDEKIQQNGDVYHCLPTKEQG